MDRRAIGLTALHLKKAKNVDRYYGGVGQMQRKLEGYSERLVRLGYDLVQTLAASRLRAVGLHKGRQCPKVELDVLVEQVWRGGILC